MNKNSPNTDNCSCNVVTSRQTRTHKHLAFMLQFVDFLGSNSAGHVSVLLTTFPAGLGRELA